MKNKDEKQFWSKGLNFECTSCGHCCRHEPGYVFLSENDMSRMTVYMDLSEDEFAKKYCRSVDLGIAIRLSLVETPDHDCIFWDKGCQIYEARPHQCRTYPFWPGVLASKEDWAQEARNCPGIGLGKLHSEQEIADALHSRENEVLINPTRLGYYRLSEAT